MRDAPGTHAARLQHNDLPRLGSSEPLHPGWHGCGLLPEERVADTQRSVARHRRHLAAESRPDPQRKAPSEILCLEGALFLGRHTFKVCAPRFHEICLNGGMFSTRPSSTTPDSGPWPHERCKSNAVRLTYTNTPKCKRVTLVGRVIGLWVAPFLSLMGLPGGPSAPKRCHLAPACDDEEKRSAFRLCASGSTLCLDVKTGACISCIPYSYRIAFLAFLPCGHTEGRPWA